MSSIVLTSKNKKTEIKVSPEKGAVCSSLKIDGTEFLYWPDDLPIDDYEIISAGLPFIFPICGRSADMPIHGFAHSKAWEVLAELPEHLIVSLKANDQTRAVYPFEFEVQQHFQVFDKGLEILVTIFNHGDKPMPFSGGFHPYYRRFEGAKLKCKPTKRLQYNEDLTDVIGEQALLKFPRDVNDEAINEQLFEWETQMIQMLLPDGQKLTQATDGLCKYLQLYAPPGEDFICLEPWIAYPNAVNHKQVPILEAGEKVAFVLQVAVSK